MKRRRRIETVLGIVLFGLFAMAGPAVAENAGQAMADVSVRLAVAAGHAAALEKEINSHAPLPVPSAAAASEDMSGAHEVGEAPEGGGYPAEGPLARPQRAGQKLTPGMTSALDGLEAAVREARTLAGGEEALAPGMEHVLTNARRMRENRELPANATSLGQEITIELFALANNARILEAEADLRAASAALGKGRADAVRNHLADAAHVLEAAREKGAYHLEDDIATLRVVMARMEKGASLRAAVTTGDVDELIGDIHEHLADLGGD